MKIKARIIAINSNNFSEDLRPRYEPRERYVQEILIPQFFSMGIEASTFDAITPKSAGFAENETAYFYGGKEYRRCMYRRGHPFVCSPIQAALTFGHLELWKESVSENTPLLILEDDACIPFKNEETIHKTISHFLSVAAPKDPKGILYLQSTCPWKPNKPLKEYAATALTYPNLFSSDLLLKLASEWFDVSGTMAYVVTPSSANILIDYVEQYPLAVIDSMMDDAKTLGRINYYIARDYQNQFILHPSF
jgi:GR25 family glycosyltransferase involved in LPS biosynthesis